MDTKTCNLTEMEIKAAIASHAMQMLQSPNNAVDTNNEIENHLERMNYLYKRLKTFKEPEKIAGTGFVEAAKMTPATNTGEPAKEGWG